ncbi:xanthine dehydrogenase small subunit [Derxia lacustris]|uniref:xanthine dehydrogenase small subunit n=1 Tax=Derxia lacustris TaxID=764842 RepID=UPI001C38BB33|nr:xanthine dehydrogenase small subunit [Derxia lacustris]
MLDDEVVEAADAAPTTTLLQYLRDDLGRTGTKEGCAEGDCGACTVLLGRRVADAAGERIDYSAINACIRLLPTVDGCEVVTAESLVQADGGLHPVQQAMVDCHGSQCGFCTPGFVMSLADLYLRLPGAGRAEVVECLAGNLCRCTGYRPIVDAGIAMFGYPEPAHFNRSHGRSPERLARIAGLARESALELSSGKGFIAPRTVAELAGAYLADPGALLLAGGTDVGLWITKQLRELPRLIYVGEVTELARIAIDDAGITVGAAVSLEAAWSAIVADYPALAELAARFASPPIRHSGTLCGNVANGSPIGDSMPPLIALGAEVKLRRGERVRWLPLELLYLGYQQKALEPGEFVEAVRVPRATQALGGAGRLVFAAYKVSKRSEQDISAVCGAFALRLDDDGVVTVARLAYGGMAATPRRAPHAEAALCGRPFDRSSVGDAIDALATDFKPLSDMRASAGYRAEVAGNLLLRLLAEQTGALTRVEHIDLGAAL